MGALICDAALQRRAKYKSTVRPRVQELIAAWPEADTVTTFAHRLSIDDVAQVLRWRRTAKIVVIREVTNALQEAGVDTVDDLRRRLSDPEDSVALRARLRTIHGVGPKTVDYIGILAGVVNRAAIDVHVKAFIAQAGIEVSGYEEAHALIAEAARARGWEPAELDGAIWTQVSAAQPTRRIANTTVGP